MALKRVVPISFTSASRIIFSKAMLKRMYNRPSPFIRPLWILKGLEGGPGSILLILLEYRSLSCTVLPWLCYHEVDEAMVNWWHIQIVFVLRCLPERNDVLSI